MTISATKNNTRKGVVVWSDGHYGPDGTMQDVVTYSATISDPVKAYLHLKVSYGSTKIVKTSEDGKVEGISFTITGNGVNKTVTTAMMISQQQQAFSLIGKTVDMVDEKKQPFTGKVERVSFKNGFAQISVNGKYYDMSSLSGVGE